MVCMFYKTSRRFLEVKPISRSNLRDGIDSVSQPAHRLDAVGFGARLAEFGAQAFDGAVDGARVANIVIAPGLFEQPFARQYAPRVDQQPVEQVELQAGQLNGRFCRRDRTALQVHEQTAGSAQEYGWFFFCSIALSAAQHGFDARHQLAHAERLGDVVVRADLEPDHTVNLFAAGGDHDDRHAAGLAQLAADVQSIYLGDHQV